MFNFTHPKIQIQFIKMEEIKVRFKAKADLVSAEIKQMLKEHGNKVIGEVTGLLSFLEENKFEYYFTFENTTYQNLFPTRTQN